MSSSGGFCISASMRLLLGSSSRASANARAFSCGVGSAGFSGGFSAALVSGDGFAPLGGGARGGFLGFLFRLLLFEFCEVNLVDKFLRWIGGNGALAGHNLANHPVGGERLRQFLRPQSEGAVGGQVRAERPVIHTLGMKLVFNP